MRIAALLVACLLCLAPRCGRADTTVSGGTVAGGSIGSPAAGEFVASPGGLLVGFTGYEKNWKAPTYIDAAGTFTMYDVTTDLTSAPFSGCSNMSATDGADSSDHTAFTCAVDDLPDDSCLYFPASGTYNLGMYSIEGNYCAIGEDTTAIIEFETGLTISPPSGEPCGGGVNMYWDGCMQSGVWPVARNIESGGSAGDTSVEVADSTGISVGDLVRIRSTSYPSFVDTTRFLTSNQMYWGQSVIVTAVDAPAGGNETVTFANDPLVADLGATGRELAYVEPLSPDYFIVENLGFRFSATPDVSDGNWIRTRYAEHVQIRGNAFGEFWNHVMYIEANYGGVIESNTFADMLQNIPNNKGSIQLQYMAENTIVQNNQLTDQEVGIELSYNSKMNVIAYNWVGPPNTTQTTCGNCPIVKCQRGIFLHGTGTFYNLIEGNDTKCRIESDQTWGQNGPGQLFFANRAVDVDNNGDSPPGTGMSKETTYDDVATCDDCAYLINSADKWADIGGSAFDDYSTGELLEDNLSEGVITLASDPTIATDRNNSASSTTHTCTATPIPTSFYLTAQPSWWTGGGSLCSFYKDDGDGGIGACNDDLTGQPATLCNLPAEDL